MCANSVQKPIYAILIFFYVLIIGPPILTVVCKIEKKFDIKTMHIYKRNIKSAAIF